MPVPEEKGVDATKGEFKQDFTVGCLPTMEPIPDYSEVLRSFKMVISEKIRSTAFCSFIDTWKYIKSLDGSDEKEITFNKALTTSTAWCKEFNLKNDGGNVPTILRVLCYRIHHAEQVIKFEKELEISRLEERKQARRKLRIANKNKTGSLFKTYDDLITEVDHIESIDDYENWYNALIPLDKLEYLMYLQEHMCAHTYEGLDAMRTMIITGIDRDTEFGPCDNDVFEVEHFMTEDEIDDLNNEIDDMKELTRTVIEPVPDPTLKVSRADFTAELFIDEHIDLLNEVLDLIVYQIQTSEIEHLSLFNDILDDDEMIGVCGLVYAFEPSPRRVSSCHILPDVVEFVRFSNLVYNVIPEQNNMVSSLCHFISKATSHNCMPRNTPDILSNMTKRFPVLGTFLAMIIQTSLDGNYPESRVKIPLAAKMEVRRTFGREYCPGSLFKWVEKYPKIVRYCIREFFVHTMSFMPNVESEILSEECEWSLSKRFVYDAMDDVRNAVTEQCNGIEIFSDDKKCAERFIKEFNQNSLVETIFKKGFKLGDQNLDNTHKKGLDYNNKLYKGPWPKVFLNNIIDLFPDLKWEFGETSSHNYTKYAIELSNILGIDFEIIDDALECASEAEHYLGTTGKGNFDITKLWLRNLGMKKSTLKSLERVYWEYVTNDSSISDNSLGSVLIDVLCPMDIKNKDVIKWIESLGLSMDDDVVDGFSDIIHYNEKEKRRITAEKKNYLTPLSKSFSNLGMKKAESVSAVNIYAAHVKNSKSTLKDLQLAFESKIKSCSADILMETVKRFNEDRSSRANEVANILYIEDVKKYSSDETNKDLIIFLCYLFRMHGDYSNHIHKICKEVENAQIRALRNRWNVAPYEDLPEEAGVCYICTKCEEWKTPVAGVPQYVSLERRGKKGSKLSEVRKPIFSNGVKKVVFDSETGRKYCKKQPQSSSSNRRKIKEYYISNYRVMLSEKQSNDLLLLQNGNPDIDDGQHRPLRGCCGNELISVQMIGRIRKLKGWSYVLCSYCGVLTHMPCKTDNMLPFPNCGMHVDFGVPVASVSGFEDVPKRADIAAPSVSIFNQSPFSKRAYSGMVSRDQYMLNKYYGAEFCAEHGITLDDDNTDKPRYQPLIFQPELDNFPDYPFPLKSQEVRFTTDPSDSSVYADLPRTCMYCLKKVPEQSIFLIYAIMDADRTFVYKPNILCKYCTVASYAHRILYLKDTNRVFLQSLLERAIKKYKEKNPVKKINF